MAREAGLEGFCYYHYWFGDGRQLLQRPFVEVLNSGEPDFPFCLCWANHDWTNKTWQTDNTGKALIGQDANYYSADKAKEYYDEVLRLGFDAYTLELGKGL